MKATCWYGIQDVRVEQVPDPAILDPRDATLRSGQTHVHRYMRPLLARIERGEIDPRAIITHRLSLDDAPRGYDMFLHKQEGCVKCVLRP